jgi:signal transduction histidine kinase
VLAVVITAESVPLFVPALRVIDPQAACPACMFLGVPFALALVALPVAASIAILRYRLYDIDLLINRTLVCGLLTASVIACYVLVVGALGALFRTGAGTGGSGPIALVATALIAVLFQPLRQRVQRGVNRLLYGQRDEPYAVLARLGRQLEATLAPESVLPAVAETVAQALKLPCAAIALEHDGALALAAANGVPPAALSTRGALGAPPSSEAPGADGSGDTLLRLPLAYQHERIGELRCAPRAPGEALSAADRRLLTDLARQVGVAAYAVRLTADLQRSREQLVAAREEERRRLRRDLHDGLGPALAAQRLKVGAARALLARDPAAADRLLAALEADLDAALADIRRLVYNLRPPALDELGLVGALERVATDYSAGQGRAKTSGTVAVDGLRISLEAPASMPPLPAAVEVAAYRIVQEALANVARHAYARTCAVRLTLDGAPQPAADVAAAGPKRGPEPHLNPQPALPSWLEVAITDDGVGLPTVAAERHAGVGLASMRERAAELGGTVLVEPLPAGGTRVLARLPLATGLRRARE